MFKVQSLLQSFYSVYNGSLGNSEFPRGMVNSFGSMVNLLISFEDSLAQQNRPFSIFKISN